MQQKLKSLLTGLATAVLANTANAETVLIANDPGPNRGVRSKAVNYLSEQIEQRTGGEVRIENNWGGALFKVTAALDSLGTGVADMGVMVGSYAQSELPELALGGMPMQESHHWVMMRAMHELMTTNEKVQQRLDEKNLVYVNVYGLPPNLLACKGDGIDAVDQVKGTKVSSTGSSSLIFKELGGNMVKMPVYEVYQSMETGLIDCTVTFSYFAVATKLNELVDTITPMAYSPVTVLATFINKDTFDSLKPEHQKIIKELGSEMIDHYGEQLDKADVAAMDTMKAALNFKSFNDADYKAMDVAAKPIFDDWLKDARANGLQGEAMISELSGLIDKWQKVLDTEGFPWNR